MSSATLAAPSCTRKIEMLNAIAVRSSTSNSNCSTLAIHPFWSLLAYKEAGQRETSSSWLLSRAAEIDGRLSKLNGNPQTSNLSDTRPTKHKELGKLLNIFWFILAVGKNKLGCRLRFRNVATRRIKKELWTGWPAFWHANNKARRMHAASNSKARSEGPTLHEGPSEAEHLLLRGSAPKHGEMCFKGFRFAPESQEWRIFQIFP